MRKPKQYKGSQSSSPSKKNSLKNAKSQHKKAFIDSYKAALNYIAITVVISCVLLVVGVSLFGFEKATVGFNSFFNITGLVLEKRERVFNKLPTYDEYIAVSLEKGWSPVDPIQKLQATIHKYTQVLDLQKSSAEDLQPQLSRYIMVLEQEVSFLLQVLRHSSDRMIDLTDTLLAAVEAVQKLIYGMIKFRLAVGPTKMVARTELTQQMGHWAFYPAREILKLAQQRHPHIQLEINRRFHTHTITQGIQTAPRDPSSPVLSSFNLLMRCVQLRLYGLISTLMSMGSDALDEALLLAIHNGDDLAVGLILNLDITHSLAHAPDDPFSDFAGLAHRLGFLHIERRLRAAFPSDGTRGDFRGPLPVSNEFAPTEPEPETPLESQESQCSDGGDSCAAGASVSTSPVDSLGLWQWGVGGSSPREFPRCAVPRVALQDLTANEFYQNYVRLNRPLIITPSSSPEALVKTSSSDWSLENLIRKHGHVQVVGSVVPYAGLFGREEETKTLRDFVWGDHGMRQYSTWLARELEKDRCLTAEPAAKTGSPPASSVLNITCLLQNVRFNPAHSSKGKKDSIPQLALPHYLFSGRNQEIQKRLSTDIWRDILTSPSFVPSPAHTEDTATDSRGREGEKGTSGPLEVKGRSRLLSYLLAVTDRTDENSTGVEGMSRHWTPQFFLGPPLSGAPLHHHSPAFNFLLSGRKLWTLLPPARDVYSNLHPLEWRILGGLEYPGFPQRDDRKGAVPCQLQQGPGEILFVPRHWTHQC